MLLDLELGALQKYLNPNKKKLESKGVDSVISRVMNLCEAVPELDHAQFCQAVQHAFTKKWNPIPVNSTTLSETELRKIPQLMEIFEASNDWNWRFG